MAVTYPYLLLDKGKCLENIKKMVNKAKKNNLKLRPHFKTHQSIEVGTWYKQLGVDTCTVASFPMAKYFASGGWNDITVAFPVSIFDVEIINSIGQQINLNITTSSYKNLNSITNADIHRKLGIYIELDCGHGRSGLSPDNNREIALMVNLIEQNKYFHLKGFITHAGHTYGAESIEEVEVMHRKALKLLSQIKLFWNESYPEISISYGDTPSCSISEDFYGVDEIRPGNFVFYDVTQASIGSCTHKSIAIALICPVVDVYSERGEATIRGGAVHLSKDFILLPNGSKSYGLICPFNGKKWEQPIEGLWLKSISQEHGVIASKDADIISKLKPGQLVAILPVHSCLTVDTMGELFLSDGTSISTMRKRGNNN
ncbi:MAG: alanine racemase [Bacteroidales bacterium]|nr:MAG: alanine racemase [Bacteroidales bacterium]